MLPEPLHPAIVHFPIVLVFLLPLFAIGSLLAIRRGVRPMTAWAVTVALAAALAGGSWLAVETGEEEEERVEKVVTESAIETHEESAELFLWLAGTLFAVTAAGLLPGVAGRTVRVVALLGALALPVAGYRVGHSGGELVYRHGAARAYTQGAGGLATADTGGTLQVGREEESEDD